MTKVHYFTLIFLFLSLPHPFLSLCGSEKLIVVYVAGKHEVPCVSLCFW